MVTFIILCFIMLLKKRHFSSLPTIFNILLTRSNIISVKHGQYIHLFYISIYTYLTKCRAQIRGCHFEITGVPKKNVCIESTTYVEAATLNAFSL